MELITIEELSLKIHKAKASIYSDLSRNPKSLPPYFRLPNSRRILFRLSDVEEWIDYLVIQLAKPKKKGRPTKLAQLSVRNKKAEVSHA